MKYFISIFHFSNLCYDILKFKSLIVYDLQWKMKSSFMMMRSNWLLNLDNWIVDIDFQYVKFIPRFQCLLYLWWNMNYFKNCYNLYSKNKYWKYFFKIEFMLLILYHYMSKSLVQWLSIFISECITGAWAEKATVRRACKNSRKFEGISNSTTYPWKR